MRHIALIALLLLPGIPFPYQPVTLEVTAYTDDCGIPPWGITASGAETQHGIAAAPSEVPFGVEIYVPGYGWAEVQDRGGSIRGRGGDGFAGLDLWYGDRQSALQWGRRDVTVWIPLDMGWPENTD